MLSVAVIIGILQGACPAEGGTDNGFNDVKVHRMQVTERKAGTEKGIERLSERFSAGTLDFQIFFRRDGKTRPDGFPEFTAEFKTQDGALVSALAKEKPFVRAVSGPIGRVGNIFTDSAVVKQDLQVPVLHDNIHQMPP